MCEGFLNNKLIKSTKFFMKVWRCCCFYVRLGFYVHLAGGDKPAGTCEPTRRKQNTPLKGCPWVSDQQLQNRERRAFWWWRSSRAAAAVNISGQARPGRLLALVLHVLILSPRPGASVAYSAFVGEVSERATLPHGKETVYLIVYYRTRHDDHTQMYMYLCFSYDIITTHMKIENPGTATEPHTIIYPRLVSCSCTTVCEWLSHCFLLRWI